MKVAEMLLFCEGNKNFYFKVDEMLKFSNQAGIAHSTENHVK